MSVSNSSFGTVAAITAVLGSLASGQVAAADESGQRTAVAAQDVLEEIVVTANKRTENIQDVTATVHAIGGEVLEQLSAVNLADFAGYVPGLGLVPGGAPGLDTLVLRGLALPSPTALVGTYIDDIPVGSSAGWTNGASRGLDLLPYDLDHIEVLEGPQGTLYGANTMGGLVKYTTRQPDLQDLSLRLGVTGTTFADGSGLGHDARATVNVPVIDGVFALRASFDGVFTPGYIDSPRQGLNNANRSTEQNGRISGLLQLSSQLSVHFAALLQNINAPNVATVTLSSDLVPDTGPLANSLYFPSSFNEKLRYYSASINYDMGWASLVSATSYSTISSNSGIQGPGPGVPGIQFVDAVDDLSSGKFSQELRLASRAGGSLEWLVGGFFTHETGSQIQVFEALNNAYVPVAGTPLQQVTIPSSYREAAIFTNDTWHITPELDLNAGARWSHNNQQYNITACQQGRCSPVFPGGLPATSSQGVFNYAAGPAYHFTPDMMAYVRVASGYRPGGPNPPIPNGSGGTIVVPAIQADTLTNYETGIKSSWLQHTLQLDASAYVLNWNKIQLRAQQGIVSYGINGSSAQVRGFDLAARYRVTPELTVGLAATYTDAALSSNMPAHSSLAGVKGDTLPYAPKWSGSATADYTHPIANGWRGNAGLGWRYTGRRFSFVNDNANCPGQCVGLSTVPVLAAYSLLDAHVGLSSDRWKFNLFARNLTNQHAWLNLAGGVALGGGPPPAINATPLEPRLIGISVDRAF